MKVSNKMTCRCKEKERELEELVHQLHVERANKERAEEDPASCHVENQPLMDETDLQVLLRDERRKSANFELQVVWWNVSLFWMKQRYNNKVKRKGSVLPGEFVSEIHAKSSPRRPEDDCKPEETSKKRLMLTSFYRTTCGVYSFFFLSFLNPRLRLLHKILRMRNMTVHIWESRWSNFLRCCQKQNAMGPRRWRLAETYD